LRVATFYELTGILRFFGSECQIRDLAEGVMKFQIVAMLAFGNFIFAYRVLSRLVTKGEIEARIGELCIGGDPTGTSMSARPKKLLDITPIDRDDTPLIGYMSTGIIGEAERARLMLTCIRQQGVGATWDTVEALLTEATKTDEQPAILAALGKLKARFGAEIEKARQYVANMSKMLDNREACLAGVQETGTRNQDVYLTWDEMDVYFATSMRKPWEYKDLFDFVKSLMSSPLLRDLDVRYFDPTQSYTPHRINKGIVESLMLKRARCTVYSVQDTDTLGKDSELAATLAQGKPVIAYIPEIKEQPRAQELFREDPLTVVERLRFVLYADEKFRTVVTREDREFIERHEAIHEFCGALPFTAVQDEKAVEEFKEKNSSELERLCHIIAASEKRIYDKRADTLKRSHPLGLQVNLDTGVANGLLVARTIEEGGELLRRVLTRTMQFQIEENDDMWYLRDVLTNSIFRVVTKHRKISNCFWNFYLRG
jgi:hypothetical protein